MEALRHSVERNRAGRSGSESARVLGQEDTGQEGGRQEDSGEEGRRQEGSRQEERGEEEGQLMR